MKTKSLLALASIVLSSASGHAKSDVDVYLIEAKEVTVEENAITITGSALTRITTVSDNPDPHFAGKQIRGRTADSTYIKSDEATFTIKGPKEPDDGHSLWPKCLAAARGLKEGKPTGRIAFYRPEVVVKGNLIVSITGNGFLMPKPEPSPVVEHVKTDPEWAGSWFTHFANGVKQLNKFSENRSSAHNRNGWSSEGEVVEQDGQLILTYKDDRIERWTRVAHRMVVEHWHPAAHYPAEKPVTGIAELER